MTEFTLSDLNRRSGEIADKAIFSPVSLTKHGRPHLVILSAERYAELSGRSPGAVAAQRIKPDFSRLKNSID